MNTMELQKIIDAGSVDGFTTSIKGETGRYIIGLTHNDKNVKYETLINQINNFSLLENINVGGWTDIKTNIKYIDISTSSNDIIEAKIIGKLFKQIAIFDLIKMEEIRL